MAQKRKTEETTEETVEEITELKDVIEPDRETVTRTRIIERGREVRERTAAVGLTRSEVEATPDLPLWLIIKQSTNALQFKNYAAFIDYVLCGKKLPDDVVDPAEVEMFDAKAEQYGELKKKRFMPFTDTDAYRLLKAATEAFLTVNCGVMLDYRDWSDVYQKALQDNLRTLEGEGVIVPSFDTLVGDFNDNYLEFVNGTSSRVLPYLAIIRRKLSDVPIKKAVDIFGEKELPEDCYGILENKLVNPCLIELIWSYWHEQGMLVQSMNAIGRRFQNIRGPAERDPLAMLEFDPLRPLNNLMWGYVQDEQHRLSLTRRAYEYDHHYGLILEGKAVPSLRGADSRSKFLESFHNLLYLCSVFYKQDDDTTVVSDAFPILIALRDVHMLLVEGAHNQFGDLPSTARIEMLMQQWLLARPEFREILSTRTMSDYPEPWMDRVDAMKRLQGWNDTNVMHFHNLGFYGEQILLTIRFGDWNDADRNQAKVWARHWRSEIQSYLHAYRIVTGVDLTADVNQPQQRSMISTQPSALLRQREDSGTRAQALPAPLPQALPASSAPQLPAPGAGVQPRLRERRDLRKQ